MPVETQTKEEKSVLLDKIKIIPKPDYSPEEIQYINALQIRLESARTMRDCKHDELDGMGFVESWQEEEKSANTHIRPKENKSDTTFQSGTVRQKIFALLSHLQNLDLSPDIHAYDENELEITGLGNAMEKIVEKTEELDGDPEKKLMREYELLKHGYVFVEELWEEKNTWIKEWIKKFEGKIKSVSWKKKAKLLYARCVRNIISGLNVYLGDITQYDMSLQPYIFTVKFRNYVDAESVYGKKSENGKYVWERWEYVQRNRVEIAPGAVPSMLYNTWRLTEVQKDSVEEIHYQDKWNNEYAILLNGVLMTPIGMPLPWGYEDYNIVQQNLEPIHPFFAYGKSLVSRMRTGVAVLDEMLKMAVLKTQKSFAPPRLNLSGRVISSKIFMPSTITSGIRPGEIPPIDDKEVQGVTVSEFNMIQELQRSIDSQSVSPTFQGQQARGGSPTATEVLELQRQARMTLGITIFANSMLEWKLSWLRLFNLFENWFNPIDTKLDEARSVLVNRYRIVNVETPIEGGGIGREMIYPTDKTYSPQDIYDEEERVTKQTGQTTRIRVINPEQLKSAKLTWQIVITPREKRSTEISKLLFRGMLADLVIFGQSINWSYLQEEFATVWDKDPTKLFVKGAPVAPVVPGEEGGKTASPTKVPGLPGLEAGMTRAMGNEMMTGV